MKHPASARPAACLLAAVWMAAVTAGAVHGANVLFEDQFAGSSLGPGWESSAGFYTLEEDWVVLQGSTHPVQRASFITAGDGDPSWTDYVVNTRFQSFERNWPVGNAIINLRVQDLEHNPGGGPFFAGSHYMLHICPPSTWVGVYEAGDRANYLLLDKIVNGTRSQMWEVQLPAGIIRDTPNDVTVDVRGGRFAVTINGQLATVFEDPNPILHGGVSLGSIWESATRYDYIQVTAVPELPPAASAALLGTASLALLAWRRRQRSPG